MGDTFDTRKTSESDRMAFWLETVCQQILPVKIDPRSDAQPRAAMSCGRMGDLSVREVVGGNHVYVRDESDVRRGDPETVQIGIPTVGASLLVQDGREAVLSPGDMVIYDSSRPFTLVMEERFHWHVFLLPKYKLRRSDAELKTLTAVAMKGDAGIPGVVSSFLLDLASRRGDLESDATAPALGENASDLIGTLVRSQFGTPWSVDRPENVLREQVLLHVDQHLHELDLDPTTIASAVGVSLRTLHQLFAESDSTLMEEVRVRRLIRIRGDLSDPRLAHRAIGRLAAAHGMPNPTVFGRAFKAEFGLTPREFRSAALTL